MAEARYPRAPRRAGHEEDTMLGSANIDPGAALTASPAARPPEALPTRKLLLVDDHELVRFGLRAFHEAMENVPIEWVEATSLEEAIEAYGREGDVDGVLLDLNLPDCKGLQGLRRLLQRHSQARVVVFSGTQDEFVVRQARALGAVGYVSKSAMLSQLRETLLMLLWPGATAESRVHVGSSALFPRFPSSAMFDRVAELGPRHLEILELVLSGCANQEICNATSLSLGTVKNYVSSLLLALDVTSRSHLISLFR
jgi:NarL family two-component system response regulator LiaR